MGRSIHRHPEVLESRVERDERGCQEAEGSATLITRGGSACKLMSMLGPFPLHSPPPNSVIAHHQSGGLRGKVRQDQPGAVETTSSCEYNENRLSGGRPR